MKNVIEKKECEKCGMMCQHLEKDGKSTKCVFCSRDHSQSHGKWSKPKVYARGKLYKGN